jgi:fermentation-respiration switch protein FrsA (DUF1100 family)
MHFTATSTERRIFFAAVALIALRVLTDNFLLPEPGTSAGDHLLSGLVPLALLSLAAAVYAGRRPGARAVIAVSVGIFGFVAGAEGWHYLTSASISGDDFISLLTPIAGAALLGLAGVTLWRSRRLDDRPAWRYTRRALIAVGAYLGLQVLVLPLVLAYGATHLSRGFVPEPDLGSDFEEVSFETSDGLELQGWYVASENGAAVISFAGRKGTQDPARLLADHGYGVLLFDRRGEGESEGEPNALGWGGWRDLEAAVAFLHEQDIDPDRIGGIGQSVGGEMMLEYASRSDALAAVVSEGAGMRSSREGNENEELNQLQKLALTVQTAGVALLSNQGVPPGLIDAAADVTEPTLLIHAEDGQGGEELNPRYYDALQGPKELWTLPDGGHVGAQDAEPEEFERRVLGFFKENLGDDPR